MTFKRTNMAPEQVSPDHYDVMVIGSGPAGLAAAGAAKKKGASVCIVERENRTGGILKQCIHDGFGLLRYRELLTGPEYACRERDAVHRLGIKVFTGTFLLSIRRDPLGSEGMTLRRDPLGTEGMTLRRDPLGTGSPRDFTFRLVNEERGVFTLGSRSLVMATGCRERSSRQIFLQGTRPAGVITAGLAQYFINIQGYMPVKRCVILGSGDIGLIMARRLTLEGAQVEGVYEIEGEPSGLVRNLVQCLDDYSIPLHTRSTVVRVHGEKRVEGVTVSAVDEAKNPVEGTERYIPCDGLVLSVGLIPENDVLLPLEVPRDPVTGGPLVHQTMETMAPGIFSCGNSLQVYDLVDHVSENGETAGRWAAEYAASGPGSTRGKIRVRGGGMIRSVVPRMIDPGKDEDPQFSFRSSKTIEHAVLTVQAGRASQTDRAALETIFRKKFRIVRPPEMEQLKIPLAVFSDSPGRSPSFSDMDEIVLTLEGEERQ